MAKIAVFASGNGSNFEAIASKLQGTLHRIEFLLCNKRGARVIERAKKFGIPVYTVDYRKAEREKVEEEIIGLVEKHRIDLIVLAGWMKILTPHFTERYRKRILNIHPALLPKYPGTNAIERSYRAGDMELGITIHFVDSGVDTGPIILQKSFQRNGKETLTEVEEHIHRMEHLYYPEVVKKLLDDIGDSNE